MRIDDFFSAGEGDVSIIPVETEVNQVGDQVRGGRLHSLNFMKNRV